MNRLQGVLVASLLLLTQCIAADERRELKIQHSRTALDASHSYYTDLLDELLSAEYRLSAIDQTITQNRAFRFLDDHSIDIHWAGTDLQREAAYRAIRIPLFGGLLGKRIPVIRIADKARFDAITDPDQLKSLVACQGNQWPDSDILEENGYRVDRIARFEVMYRMIEAGRCDYFPRSVIEIYAELEQFGQGVLMAYDDLVLSYPFPMYFFVNNDDPSLADDLESALTAMVQSGRLREFMQQHPVTRSAFPLSRFNHARIFNLRNARLPPSTPVTDKVLWLDFPGSETPVEEGATY